MKCKIRLKKWKRMTTHTRVKRKRRKNNLVISIFTREITYSLSILLCFLFFFIIFFFFVIVIILLLLDLLVFLSFLFSTFLYVCISVFESNFKCCFYGFMITGSNRR